MPFNKGNPLKKPSESYSRALYVDTGAVILELSQPYRILGNLLKMPTPGPRCYLTQ